MLHSLFYDILCHLLPYGLCGASKGAKKKDDLIIELANNNGVGRAGPTKNVENPYMDLFSITNSLHLISIPLVIFLAKPQNNP